MAKKKISKTKAAKPVAGRSTGKPAGNKTAAKKTTAKKAAAQKTTVKKPASKTTSAKSRSTAKKVSGTTQSSSTLKAKKQKRSDTKNRSTPSALVPTVVPEILTSSDKPRNKKDAVRVQAEIVDNKIAPRASGDLAPLGDGLAAYLANVNKYPLLTREQEEIIARRYFDEKNAKDAEILVTSNLRFVVKVAAEYAKFGHRLLDLIQEGNVGLMHAVKEFNPYKGVRLITYAVWWIRGYIQEYLMRQHSLVRIGTTQNQRKLFYHLQKEKNQLDQLGQVPTVKLLAAKLGVPEDDVRMMEERMSGGDISLDAPVGGDSETPRIHLETDADDVAIDDELARRESLALLGDKIQELRPQLSEKEILLLEQRLLADDPVTLQDIGEKWGVTREAVRQMESRLIKKIKDEVLKSTY